MTGARVVKWARGWNERDFAAAVWAAGGLAPGSVVLIDVAHDAECPKLAGGGCRCDPEVSASISPAAGAA